MRYRIQAAAAGVLAAALILAGCTTATSGAGSGGADPATPTNASVNDSDPNAADEMFAMMMIPHHEQAIEMSDALLSKDGIDQAVVDLAEQIKDAQGPEIALMSGWLEDWGVDDMMSGDMMSGDTDHSGHMAGMMSDDSMTGLDTAVGDEAARLFLEQMIVHHQGAIDMAEYEHDNGRDPEVVDLAQQIIDGQTAEIATMRELLGTD